MENSVALVIVIIIAAFAGCCNESGYTQDEADRFHSNAVYFEKKYNECDSELSQLKRHVQYDCRCKE